MKKISALFAVGLVAASMAANAEPITELYRITTPYANGLYGADHVFDLTVTYDDAGTEAHYWNDGLNGVAELGSGDDTLNSAYSTSSSLTLLSDAQISISGRVPPSGSSPFDSNSVNFSWRFDFLDPLTNGGSYTEFRGDSLYFSLGMQGNGQQLFYLTESYNGSPVQQSSWTSRAFITRTTVSVPEPASLSLFGLGLLGVAIALKSGSRRPVAA